MLFQQKITPTDFGVGKIRGNLCGKDEMSNLRNFLQVESVEKLGAKLVGGFNPFEKY